ncbi:hypothetical protein [Haloarchaeobius sp. DT45]|uniref:hypothetical protein n=1 Tax=Haloarchaeobius sp. DT45 TaxID=3446116 RepID=UPI003F6D6413
MAVGESDTNEAETDGMRDVLDAFDVDTPDGVVEANETGESDDAVAAVEAALADIDEPVRYHRPTDDIDDTDDGPRSMETERASADTDIDALDDAFADFDASTDDETDLTDAADETDAAGTTDTTDPTGVVERGGVTLVRVPNEAFGAALVADRTSDDDYETAHDEFKALAAEMEADDVGVDDLDLDELTLGESVSVSQLVDDLPESGPEPGDTRFVWVSF